MSKEDENPARSDSTPTFEQTLAALEDIVNHLEDGQLGLGEALAKYEKGVEHLRKCHAMLQQAEQKVNLITGVDEQGNPSTKPLPERNSTVDD